MKKLYILMIAILLVNIVNAQSPTITSFSPVNGSIGSLITINGTNLSNPGIFTIGGTSAIKVSNTDTTLVGMIMPGTVTGSVNITTAYGTAISGNNYTLVAGSCPSVQQGNKLVASDYVDVSQQGYSVSMSADGNTALVGGIGDNADIGAAWIYTFSGGVWSQQGSKLVGSGSVNSYFGQGNAVCLSADGNTAIIGGHWDNNNIGAVWIFVRNGNIWTQQGNKLVGTNAIGNASQGFSVSLSADGNTAIVGGCSDSNSIGAAWVYTRNVGGIWTQQGNKLKGSVSVGASNQGCAVSLSADGNTAIVGGTIDNNSVGAAWIFIRNGGVWSQQGSKLVGTDAIGVAKQGYSVCLSADGNTAIVGGPADHGSVGASWIYIRSGSIWTQQGSKLTGYDANDNPYYHVYQGCSVSLSANGNTAAVGGFGDNYNMGASWVFIRIGGVWMQHGNKLIGTETFHNGLFEGHDDVLQGKSISLSGDGNKMIVGGNGNGIGFHLGSYVGSAWIYANNCTNPSVPTVSVSENLICYGGTTTLSIASGNLNGAFTWNWYTSSSGGIATGSGTSLSVSPTTTTTYYARGEGGCITPGAFDSINVTVNTLSPGNAGTISGITTVCQGESSISYTTSAIANATSYVWELPNGVSGISDSNFITINYGTSATSGNITVKGHNSCGNGDSSLLAVTVNPLPENAGTISGLASFCKSQDSLIYSVPAITFATSYIWSLPGGTYGTSNTNTINIHFGDSATTGNITVKGLNSCGNGVSSSKYITFYNLIVNAGSDITKLCGDSLNLIPVSNYKLNDTNLIWSWNPGEGLSSSFIKNPLAFSDTTIHYILNLSSLEGCQATDTIKVNIIFPIILTTLYTENFESAFPPINWKLKSPTLNNWKQGNADAGGIGLFSALYNFFNISAGKHGYMYSLPFNLSQINNAVMTFDVAYAKYGNENDTLEVQASSDCGSTWTSLYSKSNSNLATVPAQMSLFIPTLASQWRNEVINLSPFIGQSNISFRFIAKSGYGNNLYIDNFKIFPGLLTGASVVCQGQQHVNYTVPAIANATSYSWTLPSGASGTSSTNSILVDYNNFAVSGDIIVNAYNSNVLLTSSTLPIAVNNLPENAGTISGLTTVCQGQNAVTYTVPSILNATTYSWTIPNGSTGTSNTNNITLNYGKSSASGNIRIKGHNSCGDGISSNLGVIVNPLPDSAGVISGITLKCNFQDSLLYSVPAISNAIYYNWTLPAGTFGSGNTNNIYVHFTDSSYSGNITVNGVNLCGNGVTSNNFITTYKLTVNAGNDTVKGYCDSVLVYPTSNYNGNDSNLIWSWSPVIGLSSSFIKTPSAFSNTSSNYIVNLTTIEGCHASDSIMINVIPPYIVSSLIAETFEGVFPPINWKLESSSYYNWSKGYVSAEGTGMSSAMFNSYNWAVGKIGYLDCFHMNFSQFINSVMTFDVAYAQYLNNSNIDTLEVQVSTNCGSTWSTIYSKSDTLLATSPVQTSSFIPTLASQWRNELINLSSFSGQSDVLIRFKAISGYGNNIFIDNLKFYKPYPISGDSIVCKGQNLVNYTLPVVPNATSYNWLLPNGAIGSSSTNNIIVNFDTSAISGNIIVNVFNSNVLLTTSTYAVKVNSLPLTSGTITGIATICQGNPSVTYSVPVITNAASYVWTLPNGVTGTSTTNSIVAGFGTSAISGNITVYGTNSCGNGNPSSKPITVFPLPSAAGVISGTTNVCQGQNSVIYSVPIIPNATSYNWTLSNGAVGTSTTDSITVVFGNSSASGNISVNGVGSCGLGITSNLAITVNSLPESAGSITGSTNVTEGQQNVQYSVPVINNATSYSWTLPNGATGISTTNSISVDYSLTAISGNITVKGNNACGDGDSSTLYVTVNPFVPNCSAQFDLVADTVVMHHYFIVNNASGVPPLHYNWSWGDGTHDTTALPTHTYATAGYYNICLSITDSVGCTATYCDSSYLQKSPNAIISVTVVAQGSLGIAVNEISEKIKIYPNPATNKLFIDLQQLTNLQNTTISIYDIQGKLILQQTIAQTQTVLNICSFAKGVYMVKVSNEIHSMIYKFVKN